MRQTPYPDINRLLESLLSHLRRIFQENLVGLYLYGSLTAGDFEPESSDIDLLAVTKSTIVPEEFDALRAMHQDFARANPEWEDRIDAVYVPVTILRTFRSEKGPFAVISPGEPLHMRDEALRDWLQNWYVVREGGVALFGPPAKLIIPLITQDEFVQAIRRYVAELAERVRGDQPRKSQAYIILSMCRALHVHREGEQASKRQAALWAQKELPEWSRLIQSALTWRQAWREEQVDHAATSAETVRFVNFVRDEILT